MSPFRKRPPTEEDKAREILDDLRAIPDDALERLVLPRLMLEHEVPTELHPTAPTFVRGLRVLLAVKLRVGKTVIPPEAVWDARGGVERWRAVGLSNLSRLLDDPETEYRKVPFEGLTTSTFMGQSIFIASLALRFDDLLAHLQVADHGAGALVAVPSQQQICWRVIEGNETMALAEALALLACDYFRKSSGRRVSPLVYWVRHGDWEPVTRLGEETVSILLPAELAAAMGLG